MSIIGNIPGDDLMAQKRELLDEGPAAEYIGMSAAFLACGRSRGITGNRTAPPPHLKLGRYVKYDVRDLDAWLDARRVDPNNRKAAPPAKRSRQAAATDAA